MTDREWLALLLENGPSQEVEAVTGDGVSRDFTVANPPISAALEVALDGAIQVLTTNYTQPDDRTVRFVTAPPADSHIVLSYSHEIFSAAELDAYLLAAAEHWDPLTQRAGLVYHAAQLAIDALLTGAAIALSFGNDAQADTPSIFDRLARLRAILGMQVSAEAARPIVFEPPPEPAP